MALALILATQVSLGRVFAVAMEQAARGAEGLRARGQAWLDERRRQKQRREVLAKHGRTDTPPAESAARAVVQPPIAPVRARASEPDAKAAAAPAVAPRAAAPPPVVKRATPVAPPLPLAEAEPIGRAPAERRPGAFTLPPASLLDPAKAERKVDERELMDSARHLEEKCREFAVEGAVVQIHPGPVVTTFEFKPDAGVKYSKVTGLADDLCLAMQAESVLIDRIPGKSTVGIQIPEPEPRGDLAARAARVGRLPALDLEADASRSARPSTASRSWPTWRRCRTC